MRQKSSRGFSFHVERLAWYHKYSMKAFCLTDPTSQWDHQRNKAGLCSLALKSKNRIETSPRNPCPDYGSWIGHYAGEANKPSHSLVTVCVFIDPVSPRKGARPLDICSTNCLHSLFTSFKKMLLRSGANTWPIFQAECIKLHSRLLVPVCQTLHAEYLNLLLSQCMHLCTVFFSCKKYIITTSLSLYNREVHNFYFF